MENVLQAVKANIAKVLVGQERTADLLLTALLAGGHVLVEDVPGMGKTVMARALAKSVDADFGRVQFTPDLLPSDVTGLNFFDQQKGQFVFSPGPVFCNILLADEINRATPRTQSSLLECMAEGQVTVDGVTRRLPPPFFVIATQNPVETLGTYPLPEAQLDRFLMRISMAPPSPDQEVAILERFMDAEPLEELSPVCSKEEIIRLQKKSRQVFVHPSLLGYIAALAQQSRGQSGIELGLSPRGSLALLRGSQAFALVQGRTFVTPEDIKSVAQPVVAHRLSVSGTGGSAPQKQAADNLLAAVTVPTEEWEK
ncbi:AAA family ATPase [Acutalibacter intestini]|uniref:AAA family ATPase n=1 Tax=Acutalibacter intestini TaxID=3093659 RepID=UPI002AC9B1B4|nr:MoxR family ATPase [Acutalibacter sp. M00204]